MRAIDDLSRYQDDESAASVRLEIRPRLAEEAHEQLILDGAARFDGSALSLPIDIEFIVERRSFGRLNSAKVTD